MTVDIREVLLDLPLVNTEERPEGMIVFNRADVPEDRREEADAFVVANGGQIGHKPLFEVIGGKTPKSVPGNAAFYALPPAALIAD
ncbi:MAG: hypothetical protein QOE11_2330 [Solirubrobacteraceae bacterium]|nr:hypothetical protein [Solirubrobacteraceae bacterium]